MTPVGWVGRLFDARDSFARMVLLDLAGLGYLIFGPLGGSRPPATQWVLAVIAFSLGLVLHRRPLVNLVVQTALLAVAIPLLDDITINQVGASWALLELTMRAEATRTIWLAAAGLAAVALTDSIGEPLPRFLAGVVGLLLEVGVPLLLGLVVWGRQARSKRRYEEEQTLANALEELSWAGPPEAATR